MRAGVGEEKFLFQNKLNFICAKMIAEGGLAMA